MNDAHADTLEQALAGRPDGSARWLLPEDHGSPAAPEDAARALESMDPTDRTICTLVHGLGLGIGTVSFALKMDPALVSWRLQKALRCTGDPTRDAALEAATAALLRGEHPEVTIGLPEGAPSWNAQELARLMPEAVRQRLVARLIRDEDEITRDQVRPGIGLGVVMLVAAIVAAFLVYGAYLDLNPMWRGQDLVRLREYNEARKTFSLLGNSSEARRWIAITWLAEGEFENALEEIEERGARSALGMFRPVEMPLEPMADSGSNGALLPRGPIRPRRPTFVYRPGRPRMLSVDLPRWRAFPLTQEPGPDGLCRLPYPVDWPPLPFGEVRWSVPGPDGIANEAVFTVLGPEESSTIQADAQRHLTHNIPYEARLFLRGHFYLRHGLYMAGAQQFELLAKTFPDAEYPRRMLAAAAEALGVDPGVFLR